MGAQRTQQPGYETDGLSLAQVILSPRCIFPPTIGHTDLIPGGGSVSRGDRSLSAFAWANMAERSEHHLRC